MKDIEDLEKLLNKENTAENLRPGSIQIKFKFDIGEEVYSPLLKSKGIIEERSYRQLRSGNTYYEYALWILEGDNRRPYTVEENWIEKGPGPVQD